jgi:hypothetical protein
MHECRFTRTQVVAALMSLVPLLIRFRHISLGGGSTSWSLHLQLLSPTDSKGMRKCRGDCFLGGTLAVAIDVSQVEIDDN